MLLKVLQSSKIHYMTVMWKHSAGHRTVLTHIMEASLDLSQMEAGLMVLLLMDSENVWKKNFPAFIFLTYEVQLGEKLEKLQRKKGKMFLIL